MDRYDFPVDGDADRDADRVDGPDGRAPAVGEQCRHQVVIGVEAYQRQRVGVRLLHPRGDEHLDCQGQHRWAFLGALRSSWRI